MRPSRAAALGARYQSGGDFGRSGVRLKIQKTRRPVIRSASRTTTTPVSQGWEAR
jgi:hypothetical protein